MPEKLLELLEIILVPIFIIGIGFIIQKEFPLPIGVSQNIAQQTKKCHNLDTTEVINNSGHGIRLP